jgi:hypothetical protein
MDRQKVIDALNAYCDDTTGCANCKIGASPHMLYCREHTFSETEDADLEILFKVAELNIPDVEHKRALVENYCNNTDCDECVLRVGGWEHVVHFADDRNCLYIEGATEEELDRAIDLIQNAVKANVEPTEDRPDYWANVCEIQKRQTKKGVEKYGRRLEDNEDLGVIERLEYLEEELIDGLMYIEHIKAIFRKEGAIVPVDELRAARGYLDKLIQSVEGV